MAKVSHHQMRRYPVESNSPNVGTATFYTSTSHRVPASPDKAKKTWGQRLKISKTDKHSSDIVNNLEFSSNLNLNNAPSALSKSMKYAETWLYGTVRGIPAPRHDSPLFCPGEVAVVVCSCPEYLNGTKKEVKKASICKKCKGSRLPLAPMGGTMRISSTAAFIPTPPRGSAGTVKLTSSSKKSRPSILGNQNDPYDLMRRSRLLSPELKPIKSRSRAKSTSPSRSRSRSRKRSPSPKFNSIKIGNRSLSANRNSNKDFKECWIEPEEEDDQSARRSILRCDINPYDLMFVNNSRNNEFSPTTDDDAFDLSVHSQKYENLLDTLYANRYNPNINNLTAIAGQRIKFFDDVGNSSSQNEGDDYIYDPVDVQNPTQEISIERCASPVRPPRTKKNEVPKEIDDDTSLKATQALTTATVSQIISPETSINGIKSILKRRNSQNAVEEQSKNNYEQINVNEVLAQKILKLNIDDNSIGKGMSISARDIKNSPIREKRNSGTQFYLPTPNITLNAQRKKVHFLVENEIIEDDNLFAQLLLSESSQVNEDVEEENCNEEPHETGVSYDDVIVVSTEENGKEISSNFIDDEKQDNCNQVTPTPPVLSSFHANGSLRRSFSERRAQETNVISPQFMDTMALRNKQMRQDARVIFSDARPKVPPPPPPPVQQVQQVQQIIEKVPECYDDDANIYEDFCYNSNTTKTIVQVTSPAPTFNKDLSAVHRLEVKHEEYDTNYEGLKKTSILINGDDCYSTVNVDDDNDTPIYQSSVVVNDIIISPAILQTSCNTITISVSSPTSSTSTVNKSMTEDELIFKNNQKNMFLNNRSSTSIIPIGGGVSNNTSISTIVSTPKSHGKTLINLDYDYEEQSMKQIVPINVEANSKESSDIEIILRNPVEAVKRNLVPHICGREGEADEQEQVQEEGKDVVMRRHKSGEAAAKTNRNSFIVRLLEDPTLGHLAEGLEYELVTKLIENSLLRLKESRNGLDMSGTKDEDDVSKLIETSLRKIQDERQKLESKKSNELKDSKRSSISSGNSYGSASYELMDFDTNADALSDCYQSCSSDLTTDDDSNSTRSKFYQMLVDATLSEIEITTTNDDDHHYESIRINSDPIYEEIGDIPPPLPLSPPPLIDDSDLDKKNSRSIFEGASKYDILSYLVDAKERGIVLEEPYTYNFSNSSDIIMEEEEENITDLRHHQRQISDISSRLSHISNISDSSEETSMSLIAAQRKASAEIERNDSGVGSETSKTSRSKWQNPNGSILDKNSPVHLCEDCDGPVETQVTESGVMYAPLVCRKCGKKRAERKEIITEIVETEEKYGRDLQIILEEFYQPMLVAGLLNQEQLSAIFLNTEELLENNQFLAEKMRDALDIANDQGDDDLLTVNIGKIFLESAPMLHAFENYCVRQGAASLLLANLEKEKELLRIFLRVSQMENTVLRRMNLNSFLMVPVQRVTKYPLLLARLYKVTPHHLEGKELLKQSQEKIELHLNHMNREAKDVPTKLWRRISSSSPGRRLSCEIDMINIKLRKMAVDVLEWNHEEVRFAIEGRLLFTQPNDGNWKKGRTIKLTSINALLVTNGKPTNNYKGDRLVMEPLNFPRHTGIREASLLLVREKSGRYTLLREPLYLDRCIICTENDWEDYFEVQEILSKDTFIFKAEDGSKTKQWYTQLQYHSQGMGTWRKRRNALANIMINGMMTRT